MTEQEPQHLTYARLATIVASRLVLNTIFRLSYPLVPFAAAHFGVSVRDATWMVTVQVVAGLVGPLAGWFADRRGHRSTMLLGLLVGLVGAVAVSFAVGLVSTVAALGIVGLGSAIYLPSMQAYVSDLTPFERRGRALGAVELSWSLSGVFAVPLLIALVEWTGDFRIPFAVIAGLLAGVLLLSTTVLPRESRPAPTPASSFQLTGHLFRKPAVWSLLLFLWLVMLGEEILFIAQAPWLADRFGASSQPIGTALFVFGLGELFGALLATTCTDRLGKLRAPMIGFGAAAVTYALLPLSSGRWNAYLLLFALFAVAFEFAIVSSFSLASSVEPAARGTVLASSAVATATGRASGSWVGIRLFVYTNIAVNGTVGAVVTVIGVVVALIGVQPQENDHEPTENEAVRIL